MLLVLVLVLLFQLLLVLLLQWNPIDSRTPTDVVIILNPNTLKRGPWGGGGLTQSPKDVPHDVNVTHCQPIHSALYFVYVKKANKTLPAHARSPTEGTKQTTAAVVVAFSPP